MPKKKLAAGYYVWTPELSYAIGLLVTDGCLSSDGRHVIMRSKDYELLKIYNHCIRRNDRIYQDTRRGRTYYRVQPSNVRFYRWLLTIGLFPRKTYSIGEIAIPPSYFRDFLRGHLDGDGTITVYTDRNNVYKGKRYINTRLYTRFISASHKHITWLHKMMKTFAPASGALLYRKAAGNRAEMWEIRLAKYDSIMLLRWLYYNDQVPCLIRKKNIALSILSKLDPTFSLCIL